MPENNDTSGTPPSATGTTVQAVVVRSSSGWQIDKSVGLSVILAVLAQCLVGIWYASGAYTQLGDHERRITHLEMTFEERTKSRDEQMRMLTSTLSDLRAQLAEVNAGVTFLKEEHTGRR